jgi:pimeloyl-ACP methyl ester carboxylesterase
MMAERLSGAMTITMRLSILLAAGAILVCCVRGGPQPADQMISIGSHRLQIHREGQGTPAVVIDAGISDAFDKLRPLQDRIAGVTQVITYNRAGYGQSEPGPLPRDGDREADELKSLLEKASVRGPYVLVGHSLGALNVMVFASKYPQDVAGLVLLDPPPLSFLLGKDYLELGALAQQVTAEWQAIADAAAGSTDAQEQARSTFFRMIASEQGEMDKTAKLVDGIATFGNIPLVVMAAGKPNPAFGPVAGEFQRYWIEQSRALTRLSTRSEFILAEESSHYLYLDAPELVAESILSVVNDVRGK